MQANEGLTIADPGLEPFVKTHVIVLDFGSPHGFSQQAVLGFDVELFFVILSSINNRQGPNVTAEVAMTCEFNVAV
jgi:hypothetical protein